MKKLSIYQYEGTNSHDIRLTDLSTEQIELFNAEGLQTYTELCTTIDNLIQKYNLQPSDKIVNYVFDKDEYLKEIVKETVQEYLN